MEKETVYRNKRSQPFSADLIEIACCKLKKETTERLEPFEAVDDEYSLFRTLNGNGSLIAAHKTYLLRPSDTILLKTADIKNCCAGSSNWEFIQYRFVPFGTVPMFEENKIYSIPPSHDEKLYLKNMFYQKYSAYDYISSVFCVLLHKLANTYLTDRKQNTEPDAKAVRFAVAYITEHLSENISMKALAEKLHFSERHFRQRFYQETGRSPKSYQQEARLTKCAYLLTTTAESVQEISDQLGYCSPYQLSRDFKKKFGISPSQYRRSAAGK